ncbi:MAG: uracil-DNA glycosylase [Chlamydiae bacterium]|nr:uracil-DNA glycosylase [Chlamydiota bacterium]MBI3277193.1 uracil-DNA glycosylase [Chlamydiota bacterium]
MENSYNEKELNLFFDDLDRWLHLQSALGKKRFYIPSLKRSSTASLSDELSEVPIPKSDFETTSFSEFRKNVLKCEKCVLAKTRTQVVFGSGNEKAKLVFVGEAPGFDEDREGEPFVGKAGQLLTKMIQAMGLKREDVYIANIIKCRPPNNRTPTPEERETCFPYLVEQLERIGPKIICALGNVAAQTLLQTEKTITRLRGMFHEVRGIKIMPTFHPAFLLRNPEAKREVWRDLQMIMEELRK